MLSTPEPIPSIPNSQERLSALEVQLKSAEGSRAEALARAADLELAAVRLWE